MNPTDILGLYRSLYEQEIWIAAGFMFLTGAMLASFGGVVIARLPVQLGWIDAPEDMKTSATIMGRSRCEGCGKPLSPGVMIPVLGWMVSRGKAACCGIHIPARYPLTEFALGLAFAVSLLVFPLPGQALGFMLLLWLCWVLSMIDLEHFWLPAVLTTPMMWVGLLVSPFEPDIALRVHGAVLAGAVMWGNMILVSKMTGKDCYAGGDVALACAAGAWLGMDYVLAFIGLGGVLFVIQCLALRRSTGEFQAFGPALAASLLLITLSSVFLPGVLTLDALL